MAVTALLEAGRLLTMRYQRHNEHFSVKETNPLFSDRSSVIHLNVAAENIGH